MSDHPRPESVEPAKPTSTVIAAALLGGVIGSAVTFGAIFGSGYTLEKQEPSVAAAKDADGQAAPPAGGMPQGGPPAGMMGGGMMGGGMMGGMGRGGFGGGGPQGKGRLTQLVGKLELLTRSNVHIELDADQSQKIAAKLAELDKAENMTDDEAQKEFDELEGMLTSGQKEAVDAVGLPGGRGGRGGRGGGGRGGPGGGGPGGMMGRGGPPGAGQGGGSEDENPFQQEANQKRLHDMLARLKPQ